MTVSECCLTKLLPYILFEIYINILALKSPVQGTGTMPVVSAHFLSLRRKCLTSPLGTVDIGTCCGDEAIACIWFLLGRLFKEQLSC